MPRVGAVRWDAWNPGSVGPQMNRSLGPAEWRSRLPWWGVETGANSVDVTGGATAAVMQREIEQAVTCGIDYWAFCWYRNWPTNSMRESLDLFRAASNKRGLKYNLIVFWDNNTGASSAWSTVCDELVVMMQEVSWLRTPGNQPILFLYSPESSGPSYFGSVANAQAAVATLRSKATAAGLPTLYLVGLQGTAGVSTYGLQAGSRYATFLPTGSVFERPYSETTGSTVAEWANIAASTKLLPMCSTGWDTRPRYANDVSWGPTTISSWNTNPTPAQIAAHVKAGVDYVIANPVVCDSDAVLIYAWNEIDEGGWLVPHKGDSYGLRLQTMARVLRRQKDRRAALRARGLPITSR